MIKKLMLGMMLLSTSLVSQAGLITPVITGADMAGITVTVNYNTSTPSETDVWSVLSTTLGTSGNAVIDQEGLSGGVSGTDWSLTQQGDSLGNSDGKGTFYGAWDFVGDLSMISSIVIDTGDTGILFDSLYMYPLVDTNGSGQGKEFTSFNPTVVADTAATYSNNVFEELYTTLTIDVAAQGKGFSFWADTDKATVPEPATMFTFALGLVALTSLRKKSSGK